MTSFNICFRDCSKRAGIIVAVDHDYYSTIIYDIRHMHLDFGNDPFELMGFLQIYNVEFITIIVSLWAMCQVQ